MRLRLLLFVALLAGCGGYDQPTAPSPVDPPAAILAPDSILGATLTMTVDAATFTRSPACSLTLTDTTAEYRFVDSRTIIVDDVERYTEGWIYTRTGNTTGTVEFTAIDRSGTAASARLDLTFGTSTTGEVSFVMDYGPSCTYEVSGTFVLS